VLFEDQHIPIGAREAVRRVQTGGAATDYHYVVHR
jgi:hypothetical protein